VAHSTMLLHNPVYGEVNIDTLMAPVIQKLWQLDINTHCCCEGKPAINWGLDTAFQRSANETFAQIGFPSLLSFRRFLKILEAKPALLKKERGWLFESSGKAKEFSYYGEENYYFAYFKPSEIRWIQNKLTGYQCK